ncbi:Signal transduction histidine kinase [Micromonospora phaseoli]|uniref:Signal transduction histidine kinase n=1 Tax=Micromonospora phaseoli TaxID=1144548 RepID=A0A1H6W5X9_9ACTN|nr:ATP-binding protein [Micromonospora phaseoli]PZW01667.1 signal transduction histidine kinase [Micromonospora phaseoli]GIJ80694.1 histidine kinase [Micromonospora phaseoli]SEJ12368.1 Signal transduction histidine kinase [Micromonospora phaseoli]
MPAPPSPTKPPAPLERPGAGALAFIFTRLPALLRLSCGLVCAVVALAVRTPPVRPGLLVPAIAVLTAWSIWYALRAWSHGIDAPLVAGDVALTSAACLAIPVLVAPEVLPGESSWIAVLASTTVINTQATAPARWSIPAGLLVTVAYAAGAYTAGDPTEASAHAATLLAQTACTAMMTTVMRRRIARADTEFLADQRAARDALVARTAREAERQQNRDLHDTVLATLTMVGQGAVTGPSTALRERCAADLRTLATLADARSVPHDATARLDERLRQVCARLPGLPVTADLPPCSVPAPVAEAVAESTHAALSNVARHAPGARSTLRLRRFAGSVTVEVTDDGPGFDPATVPAHRYGLRESVGGRMAAIGGRVDIDTAPGHGTRIRLEWSDVG